MKKNLAPSGKKSGGTRSQLELVAPNLYRHRINGTYYGQRKVDQARKTHALGTADRKCADRLLRDWLTEIQTAAPNNHDLTLGRLLEKFLAARRGLSDSTKTTEAGIEKVFRANFPRPMDTLVSHVTFSDLAAWLAKIKSGKRAATFNRWRLFVRQLFEMAEADGAVEKSPFVDRLLRPAKKQKVDRPIPTAEEFSRIVAEIRTPTWTQTMGKRGGQRPMSFPESADFVEFLGRAGLGQAEARSLRWEDVDEREMKLVRQKTGKAFSVVIPDDLKPLLARRREEAGGSKARGSIFSIDSPRRAIEGALQRLGFRKYTARNFRSWRIVGMLDRGVDVKFIASQQGHSDGGRLIMDTYSEVIRANQKAYEAEQMARANGKVITQSVP